MHRNQSKSGLLDFNFILIGVLFTVHYSTRLSKVYVHVKSVHENIGTVKGESAVENVAAVEK